MSIDFREFCGTFTGLREDEFATDVCRDHVSHHHLARAQGSDSYQLASYTSETSREKNGSVIYSDHRVSLSIHKS
jgi:hypothetical protein